MVWYMVGCQCAHTGGRLFVLCLSKAKISVDFQCGHNFHWLETICVKECPSSFLPSTHTNIFTTSACNMDSKSESTQIAVRSPVLIKFVISPVSWTVQGENVSTNEVCGAIQAFDGIAEANVYGVKVPQADGRAGMVAITMKDGRSSFL